MMTAALALALSAGAASAQAYAPSTGVSDGTVFHPAPIARIRAPGNPSYSALSHNVGPGSSVTGYGQDAGNSAESGNAPNPRAPSAGNLGSGGR
jgi:hypothetical protein